MNYPGVCENCDKGFEVTGELEQHLYTASGLCPSCRAVVFEDSGYEVQGDLVCCANCTLNDWVEAVLICSLVHEPVSAVGICRRFQSAYE